MDSCLKLDTHRDDIPLPGVKTVYCELSLKKKTIVILNVHENASLSTASGYTILLL